jgi:hypothetical protein
LGGGKSGLCIRVRWRALRARAYCVLSRNEQVSARGSFRSLEGCPSVSSARLLQTEMQSSSSSSSDARLRAAHTGARGANPGIDYLDAEPPAETSYHRVHHGPRQTRLSFSRVGDITALSVSSSWSSFQPHNITPHRLPTACSLPRMHGARIEWEARAADRA